jgi:hypothetical protein
MKIKQNQVEEREAIQSFQNLKTALDKELRDTELLA